MGHTETSKHADGVPVAHTPQGGWRGEMPPPVLGECEHELSADTPDLRGLWRAVSVEHGGVPSPDHPLARHVERIEQCGDRVVITSEPVIHDMRADGVLEHGVNDVAGADFAPIQVAAIFREGRLELYPGGFGAGKKPLVTREIIGEELVWHYGPFVVRMRRVE